ncbi:unnamed protein product, partial [Iphiclides podalirius]
MGVFGEAEGCSAARMWRNACAALATPAAEDTWQQVVDSSPPDSVWHSLRNCVAYQAGVWHNMLCKGVADAAQPAAFKLAIVLRHTPPELTARLLAEVLRHLPQEAQRELTSYALALLTDDEAAQSGAAEGAEAAQGAVLRDLQLFADCELAVLAASREEYDAHAKLVRAEYSKLAQRSYVELRIKVLNQFSQIPKLFHTAEFECFEAAARENIEREICTLRNHLLTGRPE